MTNGDVVFIFRVRYKSPEKVYEPYISPYVCVYKNKKGLIFQPFESWAKKPYVYGLWDDLDHYLETPESIMKYFRISEEKALALMEELKQWHDATRGVKIIESEDLLEHVNNELKKYKLPTYKTLEDMYEAVESYWR